MQLYSQRRITLICNRSKVDILPLPVAPYQFYAQLDQIVNCVGKVDLENFAGLQKTLVVFAQAEQVYLLVFLIPISTYTLETASAIGEAMSTD